ncbi:MAG: hypothetical protein ACE5HV_03950 [Acidobacteriota bacterium]
MRQYSKLAIVGLVAVLLTATICRGEDDFTLYELLAPDSHKFAITYDVTTPRAGARFYLNPIRRGSVATDERVVDRRTGKELRFETISGKQAKIEGLRSQRTADDARFVKVHLARPVPEGGEARMRIYKTYEDPASYWSEGERIVFKRNLGIKANVVVLPPGYELVGCSVPAIVSTLDDGRLKASFLNDRDDQLQVQIIGRRLDADDAEDRP